LLACIPRPPLPDDLRGMARFSRSWRYAMGAWIDLFDGVDDCGSQSPIHRS
jgi:hypothetical protein